MKDQKVSGSEQVISTQEERVPEIRREGSREAQMTKLGKTGMRAEEPRITELTEEILNEEAGEGGGIEAEAYAEDEFDEAEAAEEREADDEQELATDEAELTEAENYVGAETSLQVQERLADDREDALNEIGKGSPRDHRIMTRNTERLTNETVIAVQNLIKEQAVHPAKLAHIKHTMTVALLKDSYNRKFGDRN